MQLISRFVLVVLLFIFGLCQMAVASVEFRKIGENNYLLDAKLASGLRFKDIQVRKLKLGGYLVVQLKRKTGMSIEQIGGQILSTDTISSEQFKELITHLLTELDKKNMHPSRIQIELGLVDVYRQAAISAVRQAECNVKSIEHNNACLSELLLLSIRESALTQQVFEILEQYGYRGARHAISMDPIVFSPEVFDVPWGNAKGSNDAGLNMSEMWFSIYIENHKK